MSDPFLIGLTGSIGMGKSTTAQMFRDEGIAVWDADAAVHRLYAQGGAGVAAIEALCPDCIVDGAVDRERLRRWVARDDTALRRIEAVVHPLVAEDRQEFLADLTGDIAVLDIPLLFETGDPGAYDLIAVVSVDEDIQRDRVLSRGTMDATQFEAIRAKQIPDAEKRKRADVVIPTLNLDDTQATIRALIADIRRGKYARDRS